MVLVRAELSILAFSNSMVRRLQQKFPKMFAHEPEAHTKHNLILIQARQKKQSLSLSLSLSNTHTHTQTQRRRDTHTKTGRQAETHAHTRRHTDTEHSLSDLKMTTRGRCFLM